MAVAAADPSKPSPWLSVWWRPRDTIERIVSTNPKHHVLLLAALAGIWKWIDAGFTMELLVDWRLLAMLDWRLLAMGAIGGAIFGIVGLYFSAVLFSWSGRMLGGHASPPVMRAVQRLGRGTSVAA